MVSSVAVNIVRVAGALGAIEGISWVTLSLASIVLYHSAIVDFNDDNYIEVVEESIYKYYIEGNDAQFSDQIITGDVFQVFMLIHCIVNGIWCASSILVCFYSKNKTENILIQWSIVTFLVSLWDLTNVILFGIEYQKCNKDADASVQFTCANGILPVLVIAARGFILWLINIILAIVLYGFSHRYKQDNVPKTGYPTFMNPTNVQEPNVQFHLQNPPMSRKKNNSGQNNNFEEGRSHVLPHRPTPYVPQTPRYPYIPPPDYRSPREF